MTRDSFGTRALLLTLGLSVVWPMAAALGQSVGPYLYTVSTRQVDEGQVWMSLDTGYGVRAIRPFGEEGVEQRAGVVYGVSKRLSLAAFAGAWLDEQSAVRLGSVQAELMADLSNGRLPLDLSAGVGYLREYLGTSVLLMRFAAGRQWARLAMHGNAVIEKPFAANRDAVDLITSFGASFQVHPRARAGIEAIGEDLEGLFEEEEAEGGAKLMVGPVLQFALSDQARFRLGGGPIFYLSRSRNISSAPRFLPPGDSGYAVRASLAYGF